MRRASPARRLARTLRRSWRFLLAVPLLGLALGLPFGAEAVIRIALLALGVRLITRTEAADANP